MNVGSLRAFLESLAGFVRASEGAKVANELERLCAGLVSFDEYKTTEFTEFLAKAEEYRRTGVLSVAKTSRRASSSAPKASPELIQEAAQRVMALYERAADPELKYDTIDAELKALNKQLNKDGMVQLAKEVGIAGKQASKKAALKAIEDMIKDRKGLAHRVQAIGAPG